MRQAQLGRARQTRSGAGGVMLAIVVAILVVAAAAYYVLAGTGGYSPNVPYDTAAPGTYAPATGAPATQAPGGAPRYP
jgi:archaellin